METEENVTENVTENVEKDVDVHDAGTANIIVDTVQGVMKVRDVIDLSPQKLSLNVESHL